MSAIRHRLTGWNAVKSRVEQLGLNLTDDEVYYIIFASPFHRKVKYFPCRRLRDSRQTFLTGCFTHEEYDRLRPLSYPESDVILIVFSIDFPVSLGNVQDKPCNADQNPSGTHFCEGTPLILVGTKTDLRRDEQTRRMLGAQGQVLVTPEQGGTVAREIGANLNPRALANATRNLDGLPDSYTTVTSHSHPCAPLDTLDVSAATCLALLMVIQS
ncbi:hypothetical protein EDD22DRAFT_1000997 [Suillus occidentalis]|nr:hypothetical protein EDD22DRAFT_1000997 [Suillus occidentalis]